MDDTLLLSRSMSGDLDSFGQLYDRYFTRVYDFAWRVLRDEVAASDATARAFNIAATRIRDAGRDGSFGPWLFAVAHRVVLESAERRNAEPAGAVHEEAFGTFEVPDPAALDDPSVVNGDLELPSLVWEGVSILSPRDYALLDLHLRQEMDDARLAPLLGVNQRDAASITKRMRELASSVLADYVLARRSTCSGLSTALAAANFPPYTEDARRAIDSHVAQCDVCARERSALPPMLPIFAAFTPIASPFAIKGDIWADIATAWRAPGPPVDEEFVEEPIENPYVAAPVAAASGFGGGRYVDRSVLLGGDSSDWTRNRILLFAAAALAVLVFAFAGAAIIAAISGGDGDGDDNAAVVETASPGIDITPDGETPGVDLDTATPDLTASAQPSATNTRTPEPETATPPPPPPTTNTPPPAPPTATPTPQPPPGSPTRPPLIPITPTPSGA